MTASTADAVVFSGEVKLCRNVWSLSVIMPESIAVWTESRDISAMQDVLSWILDSYERDFAKHPSASEYPKISMIWKSIPSQLAKENKKFIYKVVREGARARE